MGKEQKRETRESLKEDGNKLFAHRKYEQGDFWLFWLKYVKILAAKLYSKALQKAPNNDVLFTNRALCKMKMKKFDDAAIDAREAISLQPMSVKDRVHIWLFVFLLKDDTIINYDKGTLFAWSSLISTRAVRWIAQIPADGKTSGPLPIITGYFRHSH